MRGLTWIIMFAGFLIGLVPFSVARAQSEVAEQFCAPDRGVPGPGAPGQDCAEAAHGGAWGLIILGLMFFFVWLGPRRRRSEGEESVLHRISMVAGLQRRIEKELTGWRRFQWPVLGLFFILLGVATLLGWR